MAALFLAVIASRVTLQHARCETSAALQAACRADDFKSLRWMESRIWLRPIPRRGSMLASMTHVQPTRPGTTPRRGRLPILGRGAP